MYLREIWTIFSSLAFNLEPSNVWTSPTGAWMSEMYDTWGTKRAWDRVHLKWDALHLLRERGKCVCVYVCVCVWEREEDFFLLEPNFFLSHSFRSKMNERMNEQRGRKKIQFKFFRQFLFKFIISQMPAKFRQNHYTREKLS